MVLIKRNSVSIPISCSELYGCDGINRPLLKKNYSSTNKIVITITVISRAEFRVP